MHTESLNKPAAHSRLPWQRAGMMGHKISDTSGFIVAAADQTLYAKEGELEANCAFIVKAVNSHDALVAALKKCERALTPSRNSQDLLAADEAREVLSAL